MIDIIKTPAENSVTFNSSPVEIQIRSTRGANHYFTMRIYVDGELYDTQQRSKIDDFNCHVNFENQVQNEFNIDVFEVENTGVILKNDLTKRIRIVFDEYEQGTNALKDQLELPYFYLINSNNQKDQKIESLSPLSLYKENISIPLLGLVNFPYFADGKHTIKLFTNDAEVWSETIPDGFGVFNFQLKSIDFNFRTGDNAYFTITKDAIEIRRELKFPIKNGYAENALILQNNHNSFEYFYCFGDKEVKPNYVSFSLKLENEIELKYKTDERIDYKLNTGYFLKEYLDPIQQIPKSLLLYLVENEKLIEVRITNKSRTEKKQRKFLHNYTLLLSKNQTDDVGANVDYFDAPSLVNIIKEGVEDENIIILKTEFQNALSRGTPLNIIFDTSNSNGTLIIRYNGVDETVVTGKKYAYTGITLVYLTNQKQGTPFTEVPFYMETTQGNTNTAKLIFNLDYNDVLEAAPIISVAECTEVFIDEDSKTIVATVTEPNGQGFTVQWRQIGGLPITITQTDTQTLLTRNWSRAGEYEFEIIATDIRGNQTTKTTKLKVMAYEVQLALGDDLVKVYGGKPGDSVTLRHKAISSAVSGSIESALTSIDIEIDGGKHEFTPTGALYTTRYFFNGLFDRTHVFDISGEFELPFTWDILREGRSFSVCIISVSGVQSIGKSECLIINV